MRRTLLISLMAVWSSIAFADDQKFYGEIASMELLQSKVVQTELKVTESQRTKFNAHATNYNAQTKALQDSVQKGEINKSEFESKVLAAQTTLKAQVLAELSSAQIVRLGQITLQQAGYIAVMNDQVSARLGLTQTQLKSLKDGWNKLGQDVAAAEQAVRQPIIEKYQKLDPKTDEDKKKARDDFEKEMAASNEKVQPDLKRLRKGFEDLVDKTLTAGQKKTWSDLKGPAFKPSK